MEQGENRNIPENIPGAMVNKIPSSVVIQNKKGFLTLGLCDVNSGLKTVENIIYSSLELSGAKKDILNDFEDYLKEKDIKENNISKSVAGSFNGVSIDELIIKSNEDLSILLGLPSRPQNKTKLSENLEKLKESLEKSFSPLDMIILINRHLSEDMLLSCFKTVVETKNMALENVGLSLDNRRAILESKSNSVSLKETLVIACSREEEISDLDDSEAEELLHSIASFVDENCREAFKKRDLSLGILDYIYQQGITIDDLVDAGLELCVGVEVTTSLREKLKNQILKSLEDLNVMALIMAAIRVEDDFQNHRLREVNVDDDPAYLYTDEVLGMAIANQIAGTKAIFNFKRYDEEKPGIISMLGPMVDDIFAGLVAGCMSKIFEE